MIIGDGIMLGTGGESASIFVTGLSETDTVTATNGIKTIIGKWEGNGFKINQIKSYGTWTITATDGTNTTTQDVLVDSATQYDIKLNYKLWLYKDGTSYNFENFHLYGIPSAYGHNWSVAGKITTQKIDLSKYSKICWESSITSSRGAVYFLTEINIDNAYDSQTYMGTSNSTSGETSLEDINNTVYVAVGNHAGWSGDDMSVSDYDTYYAAINSSSSSNNSYYSKVWLE